jgi:hypothetical protein
LIGYDVAIRVYARAAGGGFSLATTLVGGGSDQPYAAWFDTGDLDGDGRDDVVMVEDEREPDVERVWLSRQRNGMLEPMTVLATAPKDGGNFAGGEIRIVDLNLDRRNDVVFTSSAFDMVAVLARSDGTFHEVHTAFPTAASILEDALAVADLDCDGCPDALGANVGHIVLFPGVGCAR